MLVQAGARVQALTIELDDNRYLLRTDMAGAAHHAFAGAGLRPPHPSPDLAHHPARSNSPSRPKRNA